MDDQLDALDSHDFDEWSAAARDRFVMALYVVERLPMAEAKSLVEDTFARTSENWAEVCELDIPNTVWAYRAAHTLLRQRRMTSSTPANSNGGQR